MPGQVPGYVGFLFVSLVVAMMLSLGIFVWNDGLRRRLFDLRALPSPFGVFHTIPPNTFITAGA